MERPTSVTVFGVLNIIFAAYAVLGIGVSMVMFFMPHSDSDNPVMQLIQDNPGYAAWLKFSIVLGIPVAGALITAGIGLLKMKPWARILSIIYGIYAIIMVIVGGVVNYFCLFQPMMEKAHNAQGPEAIGAIFGAICGTFGSCAGLIYPVLLLIFMTRPKVVAAFQSPAPAYGQSPPKLPQ
jgi:hypothetical protein